MYNLFQEAKKIFTSDEDQKTLDEQKELIDDLVAVQSLMESDAGSVVKKWMRTDIGIIIGELIETNQGDKKRDTLVADLKSQQG